MENKELLYKKIYDIIKRRIDLGEYQGNEMLPSESELQKEFNVSRIKVRRTLQELEFSGLVTKIHGKGTVVNAKKLYSNLVGVSGFSKEIEKMGERASSIILAFHESKSNSLISEYLQIPLDSPIYFLRRMRLKNGRIVGINETYISMLDGLRISDSELDEKTSIYDLYGQKGFVIGRATETIEAKLPNKSLGNELHMKEGDPVFLRQRITYLNNDVPIEFSINTYRADEYKYVINLVKDTDVTM